MAAVDTASGGGGAAGGAGGGSDGSGSASPPMRPTAPSSMFKAMASGAEGGKASKWELLKILKSSFGLNVADDPHLETAKAAFEALPDLISEEDFKEFRGSAVRVTRAFRNGLVLPDWQDFVRTLDGVFEDVKQNVGGKVATHIPQLARVDPDQFAVSVCSIDGQRCNFGESDALFSIQSLCQPITYGLALEEAIMEHGIAEGEEWIHKHVGKEPSGRGANERVLDRNDLPHNPCLLSGAVMCASLVKRKDLLSDRFDFVVDQYSALAGKTGRITFANSTFLSQKRVADRLYCLSYMMKEEECYPPGTDIKATEDFYLMMASLELTPAMMAVVASTLANAGTNPLTGERIFSERTVRNILSEMGSCGMNDYSGEFAFHVGLPAKGSLSGGVMLVIPGVAGICTYSPRLDVLDNSVRGIEFCRQLVTKFTFHPFHGLSTDEKETATPTKKLRRTSTAAAMDVDSVGDADSRIYELFTELWWAAARGDMHQLRRLVARGVDINAADYDARTAFHLAAAEGHTRAVRMLLIFGANSTLKDRVGDTPEDAARRGGHAEVEALIRDPPEAIYATKAATSSVCLFRALDPTGLGHVSAGTIRDVLLAEGFTNERAPHVRGLYKSLKAASEFDQTTFGELVAKHRVLFNVVRGEQVIKDFGTFQATFQEIYDTVVLDESGENADYIPALAKADPDRFGISVCSVSGQQLDIGDTEQRFGVQSITKVINYCVAQTNFGEEKVHSHVGHEPSGRLFNEICLNEKDLPHNPCINAGAMMTCSLLWPEESTGDRFSALEDTWASLTGGVRLPFNNSMYLGEKATADRNFCLGYYMKGAGAFPDWIKTSDDLMETLSLYFMTCSIEVATEELAVVAATLANGGTNPVTGKKIFEPHVVRNALTVMQSCGVYDGSGEFAFSVGFPCKSGVGGGLMIIVPGRMGVATFSPRLDAQGNSQRGVQVCKALTARFNFHNYDTLARGKVDPTIRGGSHKLLQINDLLQAAYTADDTQIHDLVNSAGLSVNAGDYDNRTALHLAATAGHGRVVDLLLELGADKSKKDRWGATPADNARDHGFTELAARLA